MYVGDGSLCFSFHISLSLIVVAPYYWPMRISAMMNTFKSFWPTSFMILLHIQRISLLYILHLLSTSKLGAALLCGVTSHPHSSDTLHQPDYWLGLLFVISGLRPLRFSFIWMHAGILNNHTQSSCCVAAYTMLLGFPQMIKIYFKSAVLHNNNSNNSHQNNMFIYLKKKPKKIELIVIILITVF